MTICQSFSPTPKSNESIFSHKIFANGKSHFPSVTNKYSPNQRLALNLSELYQYYPVLES